MPRKRRRLVAPDKRGRRLDLKFRDFTGARMRGRQLVGADLSGTCFRGADLSDSDSPTVICSEPI
jgi:uncharacterized protein YjbI with pentapeptide repeats